MALLKYFQSWPYNWEMRVRGVTNLKELDELRRNIGVELIHKS